VNSEWNTYLLIRAVRGPLMLIAVGALFAIDNMGLYGFERTWPVLIILFGVMKLFERLAFKAVPPPPYVPMPPAGPMSPMPPQGGLQQ
jgi:hypothetical protein